MAVLIGALIGAVVGVAGYWWWLKTARSMEDLNLPPLGDRTFLTLGAVSGAVVGALVGLLVGVLT
jgi:hypothetical protein